MRANVIILMTGIWAVTACSAMDQMKQSGNDNSNKDKNDQTEEANGSQDVDDSTAALGLADTCTFADGCFTCEPRELPVEACVPAGELPAGFDPAASCTHEEKKLTCDIGGAEPFVFDFTEKNKDEKLFDSLPTVLAGVGLFMGQELKDKPEQLKTLMAALEILSKHKKGLFTGDKDADAAFDEAAKLAKEKKPGLTDKELADMKAKFQDAMAKWKAKKKAGAGDGDILTMAQGLLGAMPADLVAKLPKFDISSMTEKLNGLGAGGLDIASIMKILPGGGLESILAILNGGEKPKKEDDDADDDAAANEEDAD